MTQHRTHQTVPDAASKRLALSMVLFIFGFLFLQASRTFAPVASATDPVVFLPHTASLTGLAVAPTPFEAEEDPFDFDWLDDVEEDDDTADCQPQSSAKSAIPSALSTPCRSSSRAYAGVGDVPFYILYQQMKAYLA